MEPVIAILAVVCLSFALVVAGLLALLLLLFLLRRRVIASYEQHTQGTAIDGEYREVTRPETVVTPRGQPALQPGHSEDEPGL